MPLSLPSTGIKCVPLAHRTPGQHNGLLVFAPRLIARARLRHLPVPLCCLRRRLAQPCLCQPVVRKQLSPLCTDGRGGAKAECGPVPEAEGAKEETASHLRAEWRLGSSVEHQKPIERGDDV